MNENERKLNILKTENPFTSSSVGDPWEERYPDVQSINKLASDQITQLIYQKTKDPALPCAGLVFGEVGSGKTHLISRILKYGKQIRFPFSFAYIQPIEDPEQTYRYLLREVIVNLCYPIDKSSSTTQLDIILEKSFAEAIEKKYGTAKAPLPRAKRRKRERLNLFFAEFSKIPAFFKKRGLKFGILDNLEKILKEMMESQRPRLFDEMEKNAIEAMRLKFPDIPKEFFKVLFQYQIPKKRSAAMEWLKGGAIDEEDAQMLQVSDRLMDSPAQLEQKSRNILSYIGILLEYYHLPLVICFDRLENYDTDEKIRSLGKMVEFLVDKAKAMLPIAFVRGQQWEENFTKKLNQQVITRLKTNEFRLKGCNSEQSLEIIQSRLALVFKKRNLTDMFPFDKKELENTFITRLHSPRQVIILANQKLKQILYPDKVSVPKPILLPIDKLQDEFENQCRNIQNNFNQYQPDRSRLKRALTLYLNHTPETSFSIESLIEPEDKYIDFESVVKTSATSLIQTIFIIDIESNNAAVRASLSRGVDFLKKYPDGKAYYIRDARCAIPEPPQWKATNEMLQNFKELGGNIIFLESEQAAQWYALSLLNYAVKEGDITILDVENQPRSVSSEELAMFVQNKIHGGSYKGFWRLRFVI